MRYHYQIRVRPADLWRLSMCHTYHSLVGMCHIIFGTAMILLAARFWNQVSNIVQALLFLACLLVPVLQPLGVYFKAKFQASLISQDMELGFAEDGIHVALGGKNERISWAKVRGIRKEAGAVVLYTDACHGYILTNRVLGGEKQAFCQYVEERVRM